MSPARPRTSDEYGRPQQRRREPDRGSDWLSGEPLSRPATVLQVIMIVLGLALLLTGMVLFVTGVPGPQAFQWTRAIGWGIAGLIISDVVLSPVAIVLGVLVLRRLPPEQQPVARAALFGLICLLIVVLVMAGARGHQQNPTAVPNDPLPAAVVGVAVIISVLLVWEIVLLVRRRRPA
ncbi:hypothetical protein [Microlunatus soli]|uniref:Uncharacterized protein n=1 Tax=Microlunatus soli TaxID=630515 RepID=A0A1H1S013_9ACTN|nr:hypothetical protein [Microlunatus soli]SDS40579.1 hypothetical protein SAMN04489812_1810 [Microlunatus soli]